MFRARVFIFPVIGSILLTISLDACSGGGSPTPALEVANSKASTPLDQLQAPTSAVSAMLPTPGPSATQGSKKPPPSTLPTPAPTPGATDSALPVSLISSSETPLGADSLADSVGLNTAVVTHYGQPDFPTLVARTKSLGVRHIRDAIEDGVTEYNAALRELLGSTNAKLQGVGECNGVEADAQRPNTPADIQTFQEAIGGGLEAVEAPNEVDDDGDAQWVLDTNKCLPALRVAEPSLPLIGPSLADPLLDAPKLGNVSSQIDFGNIHRYFAGHNPETAGWGGATKCGTYGGLGWAICEARLNSGTKPIEVTETGYNSSKEVNEAVQAEYLSRTILINLEAGITRTYIFDLKDSSNPSGFGGDGLLRHDDSRKPAFDALANEIAYFSDPGAKRSLVPLYFSLSSAGTKINHLLFQRRNGVYVLALWNESSSWDPTAMRPIAIAPQVVKVQLNGPPLEASAVSIDDSGALVKKTISTSLDSMAVTVDDHITFVRFRSL